MFFRMKRPMSRREVVLSTLAFFCIFLFIGAQKGKTVAPDLQAQQHAAAVAQENRILETCKGLLSRKFPGATHSVFGRNAATMPGGKVIAIIDAELRNGVPVNWRCDYDPTTDKVRGYVTQ